MAQALTTDDFLRNYFNLDRRETNYVDIGGETALPVRARPAPNAKTLVVLFHGAMNRENNTYPTFLNYRRRVHPHAHQVAIADPSLSLTEKITNGWFAGSYTTPLQDLLPPFFNQLAIHLGVNRIIFVGGSGGGFAALYYSWHFKDSTAIVAVPQTSINTYYHRRRDNYLEACWPEGVNTTESTPCLDLRDIYSTKMDNQIVYLQSTLDQYHLHTQMTPFLSSLPRGSSTKIALKCSYWGKPGHSGAIPTDELDSWVRAAVDPNSHTVEQIVQNHHDNELLTNTPEEPHNQSRPAQGKHSYNKQDATDLELTDKLAQHALEESEKNRG